MKQLFFIIIVFLLNALHSNAQSSNNNSSILMKGKFELFVNNNKTNNVYTLSLQNNLPGIYHIQAVVEMTNFNGQKWTATVNKRQVGRHCVLYQDLLAIQEINFKSITIDYQQFGESFRLTWHGGDSGLNFNKDGKEYSYASPFTLHATSFNWSIKELEKLIPSNLPLNQEGVIAIH